MATTAEQYGFGARARYAEPRASEYDMRERARLSGLFPRVNDEPMGNTLVHSSKHSKKTLPSGLFLRDVELWKAARNTSCKAERRWTPSIKVWPLGRALGKPSRPKALELRSRSRPCPTRPT